VTSDLRVVAGGLNLRLRGGLGGRNLSRGRTTIRGSLKVCDNESSDPPKKDTHYAGGDGATEDNKRKSSSKLTVGWEDERWGDLTSVKERSET